MHSTSGHRVKVKIEVTLMTMYVGAFAQKLERIFGGCQKVEGSIISFVSVDAFKYFSQHVLIFVCNSF